METRMIKIRSHVNNSVVMKIIPGHFATNHSHINYFVDMTTLKARQSEAAAAAQILASKYENNTIVDTIICMDGCEVIGAYMAEALKNSGIMSMNSHDTIYVVSPEYNANNQLIFRDNMQFMIRDKNVLLLLSSATTGKTIERSLECIQYYGGTIRGISAIFSAAAEAHGMEINSIFTKKDIPDYETYKFSECPKCKAGEKVDAIVNSYGYSKI